MKVFWHIKANILYTYDIHYHQVIFEVTHLNNLNFKCI